VAVFPDRIVLKNSADSRADIEAAIATGGTDAITQGEIVLGLGANNFTIYTKAADGSIISLDPGAASGEVIISSSEPSTRPNGDPLQAGDIWFNSDTAALFIRYLDAQGTQTWVQVSGGSGGGGSVVSGGEGGGRGDGGNFTLGTVDATFVMGVYGGGDFDSQSEDIPVELLGTDDGPDAGSF